MIFSRLVFHGLPPLEKGSRENRGFSNVSWCQHSFWPGTKVHFKVVLGILGALCKGKGVPLVRYLCTSESHFTCSSPRCALRAVPQVRFF